STRPYGAWTRAPAIPAIAARTLSTSTRSKRLRLPLLRKISPYRQRRTLSIGGGSTIKRHGACHRSAMTPRGFRGGLGIASMAALAVLGCSSRGAVGPNQSSDGGSDAIEGGHANPCGCSFETYAGLAGALALSWDCFCQGRDCSERLPTGPACDGESSRVD